MSKQRFTPFQRYAIFTVHGEKCYLCTCPVDLKSMQIDHILPENLLEKPNDFREIRSALGLSDDFVINSYENWLPACASCNNKKRDKVFSPTPMISLILDGAAQKADAVRKLVDEAVTRKKVASALNTLQRANENGDLTDEDKKAAKELMPFHEEVRTEETKGDPLRITPLYRVLFEDEFKKVVSGPYGTGVRPSGNLVHGSWDCPNCGSIGAWSGARCIICGMMDDD